MANSKITITLLLTGILAASAASAGSIVKLGTFGQTYSINEPDIIDEITALAKLVNFDEKLAALKNGYKNKAAEAPHLPHATTDRDFSFEPSYTLDVDIVDNSGRIAYPAGFTFNPIKYSPVPSLYVVLDGSAPEQVAWFRASDYYKAMRVKVILSGGVQTDLVAKLGVNPSLAEQRFLDRLGVTVTPSVVQQEGDKLHVFEVFVPKLKDKQSRGKKQ